MNNYPKSKNKLMNEEELFGYYVTEVLKSFDPKTRDLCIWKIQDVFFKLRHYANIL